MHAQSWMAKMSVKGHIYCIRIAMKTYDGEFLAENIVSEPSNKV